MGCLPGVQLFDFAIAIQDHLDYLLANYPRILSLVHPSNQWTIPYLIRKNKKPGI